MLAMLADGASAQTAGQILGNLPWTVKVPLFGLPIFWVACFLIYLLRCAIFGMERTDRIDKVWESPWLPRIVMEFGYWMFRIPVRICIALGITPNMITFGSMLLTIAAAVAIGLGHFALGGWTLLFAFTCDAWDGIVARATNSCSPSGEFFDSTIDRYNDLITFFGYVYYYRNDPLVLLLIALAIIGSTVVSYTRAKGDAFGINASVGYMQRHERAVWLGGGTVFAPIVAAFVEPGAAHPIYHTVVIVMALTAIMTNITALWRMSVVMTALRSGQPTPVGKK
jgi:CDP-diacylglycerol--glycerol-3-phosphate 3-phosphatidyltransferase